MLDFASDSIPLRTEKLPVIFTQHFGPFVNLLVGSWARYPFLLCHYSFGKSLKFLFVGFSERCIVEAFVDPIVIRSFIFSTSPISSFSKGILHRQVGTCLLYTSPSPRDRTRSRMPSSA